MEEGRAALRNSVPSSGAIPTIHDLRRGRPVAWSDHLLEIEGMAILDG
jgi:hypothetical protein